MPVVQHVMKCVATMGGRYYGYVAIVAIMHQLPFRQGSTRIVPLDFLPQLGPARGEGSLFA